MNQLALPPVAAIVMWACTLSHPTHDDADVTDVETTPTDLAAGLTDGGDTDESSDIEIQSDEPSDGPDDGDLCTGSGNPDTGEVDPWIMPENNWPNGTPPACLVGQGFEIGDVVPDVRALDQFGEEVALWQFTGHIIVLDVAAIWCRPCQLLAQNTESIWQQYRDEGVVYLTVIHEDSTGGVPDVDDLRLWAQEVPASPITAPIISDWQGQAGTASIIRNGQYPAVLVVGRDLLVRARIDDPSDAAIRQAIDESLAESPAALQRRGWSSWWPSVWLSLWATKSR